jgi:hypothetical protein
MSDVYQFGAKESVDQKRSYNPRKSIRMHTHTHTHIHTHIYIYYYM